MFVRIMTKQPAILTMGYQQRTGDELVRELVAAGVDVVIDVRETPWSHRPDFSKGPLMARLADAGIEYCHAWFAGNPKQNRATASSQTECLQRYAEYLDEIPDVVQIFAELVEECVGLGLRVCLLCYERHPAECHRTIILDKWKAATGSEMPVVHLCA